MANDEYTFLSTGINELNAMLTRNEKIGIAIPAQREKLKGVASSTMAIKGPTGKGKSVLMAILSNNLHWQCPFSVKGEQKKEKDKQQINYKNDIKTFSIYYSFNQPARSLHQYIDTLIRPDKSQCPYPLIVSPTSPRGIPDTDGVSVLRRFLIENLAPVMPEHPEFINKANNESPIDRFKNWANQFTANGSWRCGFDNDNIKPVFPLETEGTTRITSIIPIVFIDPINYFFHYQDSRQAVSELFATFRSLGVPLIVTLEDAGSSGNETDRQLAHHVEFEADVLIELSDRNSSHKRNVIEVRKNRNFQPIFGQQIYRIEKQTHALSNISSDWKKKHPGILIFRSIHWYLSTSRKRIIPKKTYKSGIPEFDQMLSEYREGHTSDVASSLLPPDAFVLIKGSKGGHKLSLAFNLLVGGLLDPRKKEGEIGAGQNVMLISLGEETSINIQKIALYNYKEKKFPSLCPCPGNGEKSEGDHGEAGEDVGRWEVGQKVMIHEWQFDTKSTPASKDIPKGKIYELTFKPGHLSPEEFLWIIENCCEKYQPSRILVENTAHLRMRFPELSAEPMLFPALSSITHSRQIMLIATDVMGDGSDVELSYGLAACADYIAKVEPMTEDGLIKNYSTALKEKYEEVENIGNGVTWAGIEFSNIRGKNYLQHQYCITVLNVDQKNEVNRNIFYMVKKTKNRSHRNRQECIRRRLTIWTHNDY